MRESKEDKELRLESSFHTSMRKVHKKISKPIIWNDQEFESARALGRHLRLTNHNCVTNYVKGKKPLKGHIPVYKKVAS